MPTDLYRYTDLGYSDHQLNIRANYYWKCDLKEPKISAGLSPLVSSYCKMSYIKQ